MLAILRHSWLAIIAAYLISRAWSVGAALGVIGYPSGPNVLTDVNLYSFWSAQIAAGNYPVDDSMWQYPPLAGMVFLLNQILSEGSQIGFFALAMVADLGIMLLLLRTSRQTGHYTGSWLWALAAFAIGPIFLARFDIFVTAIVVAALLVISVRPWLAGTLLGIGTALKVWPILLVLACARSQLAKVITGAMAAVIVTTGVLLMTYGTSSLSFATEQSERGLQVESPAALPYMWALAAGSEIKIEFRYGAMEIIDERVSVIAAGITLLGLAVFGLLGILRLLGRLEQLSPADVALALVLVSISTSRVFSPQYAIWFLGIAAACLVIAQGTKMKIPIGLLICATLLSQVIFPPLYTPYIGGEFWPVAAQTARILAVLLATCWSMAVVLRSAWTSRPRAHPDLDRQVVVAADG